MARNQQEINLIKFYRVIVNKIINSTKPCRIANKRSSPYVAAEIQNYINVSSLTIGDGRSYGGHMNAPLEPGATYNVVVRAVTQAQNGGVSGGSDAEANVTFTTTTNCSAVKVKPIIVKPIIDKTVASIYSLPGNTIKLKCLASGKPTPSFMWYNPADQPIISDVASISGGVELSLTTTNDQNNYGRYKCKASNTAGTDVHSIDVIQMFPPGEPVVKVTDSDITTTSITVRWIKSNDDRTVSYTVQIDTQTPITTTNTFHNYTRLTPDTYHIVMVFARNKAGIGRPTIKTISTKPLHFTPSPSTKPPVQPLSTVNIVNLSITVHWKAPNKTTYPTLMYSVHTTELHDNNKNSSHVRHVNEGDYHFEIPNRVQPGKTFRFLVTAWDTCRESKRDRTNGVVVKVETQKP